MDLCESRANLLNDSGESKANRHCDSGESNTNRSDSHKFGVVDSHESNTNLIKINATNSP